MMHHMSFNKNMRTAFRHFSNLRSCARSFFELTECVDNAQLRNEVVTLARLTSCKQPDFI